MRLLSSWLTLRWLRNWHSKRILSGAKTGMEDEKGLEGNTFPAPSALSWAGRGDEGYGNPPHPQGSTGV